jgi:hypothetical protein
VISGLSALAVLLVIGFAQAALAQNDPPLNFGNNFFVTGDYVVAGAVGINQLVVNNLTTGTITVPDANPGITGATSVPTGAQIVAAFLYWETVESNNNLGAGNSGFFLPMTISNAFGAAGPPNGGLGYKIQGVNVSPNSNVAWSKGGCPGTSTGRVVSVYRADVRSLLPVDGNGNVLAGSSGAPQKYQVTLPSSSNGSPPITLGATLVVIYRVLSEDVPLNSIVIYEGAFGQSTINVPSSLIMLRTVQGFYDAAATPVNRLTHIVGGGQNNKFQTAYFSSDPSNLIALPSLYGSGQAAFPGYYVNWDNPTWTFGDPNYPYPANPVGPNSSGAPYPTPNLAANPIQEDAASATTKVVPSTSQQGCVDWGAVIVETRVKNRDNDEILDSWKTTAPPGYCDAALNNGVCTVGNTSDPGWVALPGAQLGTAGNPHPDIFVQLDYVCQNKKSGANACDTGYSFQPADDVVTAVTQAFADNYADGKVRHQPLNLHVVPGLAVQEQTCSDATNNNVLCTFPDQPGAPQPGVIGWKWGYALVKNQLVDPNGDTSACTTSSPPANCMPRFQHGRKDSFHYALFGHALGNPKWGFLSGLTDSSRTAPPAGVVSQSGNTVTFYTTTGHGLVVSSASAQQCLSGTTSGCPANGRVTISDATSNPKLNGTWLVTYTNCPTNPTLLVANDCSVSNPALGPYEFQVQIGTSVSTPTSYTQKTDPNLGVTPGKAGTGSGISDIGGADTLVTLGNWPAADVTSNVIEGIFAHELGHGLGLTHGGLYYNNLSSTPSTNLSLNDYTPTYEANCKPNFLSVMSYSFAVDLLDNQFLDYAEEWLPSPTTTLDEFTGPSTPFTSNYYLDTAWYAPTIQGDTHAASRHCDGSPILTSDDQPYMVRMFGPTSFSPTPPQDINFDGNYHGIFQGHSDWSPTSTSPGVDLRQISAIGNLSVEGPGTLNGGPGTLNGGPGTLNGGPGTLNGGPGTLNGGPGTLNGGPGTLNGGPGTLNGGPGDLAHESLKSYARPPLNPVASEDVSARIIHVTWHRPFGSPVQYDVYRSDAGGPYNHVGTISVGTPPPDTYTFNDNVECNPGGHTYYVTSTALDDITNQPLASQPSNPTSNLPKLTGCYTNTPPTVLLNDLVFSSSTVTKGTVAPVTWSLQDDDTAVFVSRLAASTALSAIGPIPYDGGCPTTPPANASVTTVSTNGNGIGLANNQFSFGWNTTNFNAGCYFFKLNLDSGQFEVTTSALSLLMWVSDRAFPTLTTTLPNAVSNKSYSNQLFQAGGTSPFTWTVVSGALPPGILLGSSTGTISGKPAATGSFTFGVKVTDVNKNYGTQTFTLAVCKPSGC